jgi:hypothetical protein
MGEIFPIIRMQEGISILGDKKWKIRTAGRGLYLNQLISDLLGWTGFCFKLGFTDLLLIQNLKPPNWTTQYFLGN